MHYLRNIEIKIKTKIKQTLSNKVLITEGRVKCVHLELLSASVKVLHETTEND